jgi:hypothetical protein
LWYLHLNDIIKDMKEVAESCILPGVNGEVVLHTLLEDILSEDGKELLQHCSSFRVGDTIKTVLTLISSLNLRHYRVSGTHLILSITPILILIEEEPWINVIPLIL